MLVIMIQGLLSDSLQAIHMHTDVKLIRQIDPWWRCTVLIGEQWHVTSAVHLFRFHIIINYQAPLITSITQYWYEIF